MTALIPNVPLEDLREELRAKEGYNPKPSNAVYIPKPDGRMSPLGIPTVKDRIVQMATLLVIEPIFEADFLDSGSARTCCAAIHCSSGKQRQRRKASPGLRQKRIPT